MTEIDILRSRLLHAAISGVAPAQVVQGRGGGGVGKDSQQEKKISTNNTGCMLIQSHTEQQQSKQCHPCVLFRTVDVGLID